jgi:hypothetical protein
LAIYIIGDNEMKRFILALAIITVAFSGCTEKAPSSDVIKTSLNHSAANLSAYSFTISDNQTGTIKDLVKDNITNTYNTTSRSDDTMVAASIDLASRKAVANVSTTTIVKGPTGLPIVGNSESTEYNIGNITYVLQNGNWTRLMAPESAEAIWASGSFDLMKSRATSINRTQADVIGSESVDGKDCYKLRLTLDNQTYLGTEYNLLVRVLYPFVPEANETDLLKSSKNENLVWVEKDNNLLKKYEHTMSMQMAPNIAGIVDNNGNIRKLNQTMKLVEVTLTTDSVETYTDFNKPVVIVVPRAALNATLIVPSPMQVATATGT